MNFFKLYLINKIQDLCYNQIGIKPKTFETVSNHSKNIEDENEQLDRKKSCMEK